MKNKKFDQQVWNQRAVVIIILISFGVLINLMFWLADVAARGGF